MARTLVFSACSACILHAQGRGVPSGVPEEGRNVAADSTLVAWLAKGAMTSRPPAVYAPGRWRISLAVPDWVPSSAAREEARLLAQRCGRSLGLVEDEITALGQTNPWSSFDSAATGRPLLLISLVPDRRTSEDCGGTWAADPDAVRRGVLLPSVLPLAAANDPVDLHVMVDTSRVMPVYLGRVDALVIGRAPDADRVGQLRFYLPMEDAAPRPDGTLRPMRLIVRTRDSSFVDTLDMPRSLLLGAWTQALSWRLGRGGHEGPEWSAVVRSFDASARWDRIHAQVRVGQALIAGGDTAVGRLFLREALSEEPCLSSAPSVPSALRAAMEPLRSRVRCDTMSPVATLARGLALPGLAHRATRRTFHAVGYAGLTGMFAALALSEKQKSNAAYRSYQAAQSTPEATRLFAAAEHRQSNAVTLATVAATVWAVSAVEAVVVEYLHVRHMRRVRPWEPGR